MGQVVCGPEDEYAGFSVGGVLRRGLIPEIIRAYKVPDRVEDQGGEDINQSGSTTTITQQQEVFVKGQLPRVHQNLKTFDDDDMVIQFSTNVLSQSLYIGNGQKQQMVQQYDLNQNVDIRLSSSVLESQSHQTILIQIVTKSLSLFDANGQQKPRNGVDLICLIDHSGNMQGDKLMMVKRSLKCLLEVMSEKDRLCIIMFDCKCQRLTRLMKCSPNNLNKFLIAIDALEARGGIEIGNAMKMALSVLKHRRYKIQYLQYFY